MYCTYMECTNQQRARGYCNRHYKQLRADNTLPRKYHYEYHGMYGTPEHWAWAHMIQRCFNTKDKRFSDWGGRGISVCAGLRYSFNNFFALMGNKPADTQLDRIDNEANYSCGSCEQCLHNHWPMNMRWASLVVQQNNKRRRRDNTTGLKNICWSNKAGKWTVAIMRDKKYLLTGYFNTIAEAKEARDLAILRYNQGHGN